MTAVVHLNIEPRDPVIARDGRPAGTGLRMRSVGWIYPSVLAGSLRTLIGHSLGGFPSDSASSKILNDRLKAVSVAGPLPLIGAQDGELAFPAPLDLAVRKDDDRLQAYAARPAEPDAGSGCDLPPGRYPVVLSDEVGEEFKPAPVPAFWSSRRMASWLVSARGDSLLDPGATGWPDGFYAAVQEDARMHAAIDAPSGAAARSRLFMTTGLDFARLLHAGQDGRSWAESPEVSIAARVMTADDEIARLLAPLSEWAPLGGERRIACWTSRATSVDDPIWSAPPEVQRALADCGTRPHKYVRLALATPAIFRHGWLPEWAAGAEPIPGTDVVARLIGACVGRWKPISGWNFETQRQKAARRLVPAGSVYFLEIERGDPAQLAARAWLAPVSDDEQDRRDGFGLALWGVWEPFKSDDRFETSKL